MFMFFKQKFTTEPRIDKIKLSLYRQYSVSLIYFVIHIIISENLAVS